MVLGLLRNIPILNSFLGKSAASQESSETEAAAKANEKAIAQEGLKPLFIVILPAEGDFSELKAKLKEKFNGRDLHFEVDPELKKPKLYILKPNALAKRNLETALDKAFIKDNYRSIELSGDANKLGESLVKTMSSEFIALEGAERKIEYTQKEAEKAKLRQSLKSLSKVKAELASPAERLKAVGVNSCANGTCGHDHGDVGGGNSLDRNNGDQLLGGFIAVGSINNDNETVTEQVTSIEAQPVNNKDTVRQTTPQKTESLESHPDEDTSNTEHKKPETSSQNTDSSQKPKNIQKSPRSHNSAQLQIAQQRREDLKAFLTKLKDIGNDHSKHNELIQSSNSAYIIHNKNTNGTFDRTKIEITFAHRENANDNFTIHRLPLISFLNGDKLTISTEKMTHTDIHEREMHSKDILQAQYMLSLLKQLEQKSNSTERDKIIENDFKSNLNKISDEIKASLQKITAAAKRSFNPNTTSQSLSGSSILSQGGSFSNANFNQIDTKQSTEAHLARESVNKSIKELLSNIFAQEYKSFKTSAKEVLSKFTPEETKQLNSPISQYFNEEINQSSSMIKPMGAKNLRSDLKKDKIESYISSKIEISQQIDLLPRLMNKGFSYENNLKGALEQSNQSSIHTNRQLAETKHLQNTTNNSGKEEHDKQVGGIALTGQLSFIDRKDFHERNQTYKDFPPLPEGWKTEPKQTASNTNQTSPNHESTNPASTAADNSTKATGTVANSNNSSTASSPQIITETHEEKQTINQGVNNNEA
jgi:hypothetical protein